MGEPFNIIEQDGYRYVAHGPESDAPPIVLLHGMLGDHSNWSETIEFLSSQQYRVIVPMLPVYNMSLRDSSVSGLARYVHGFVEAIGIREMVLAGNSLGGHIALIY
ncbi:MAG: alpha/beta fold hydrolase, partial [Rhodothermales bacterium]|nr:alpha/beta fold hydrolase [Rhodothermales bacterium]